VANFLVNQQDMSYIHCVREKKRPQYFRHNFDKLGHSFVIFGTNHPDASVY